MLQKKKEKKKNKNISIDKMQKSCKKLLVTCNERCKKVVNNTRKML